MSASRPGRGALIARWLKFNVVGWLGVVVQLGALALFLVLGVYYLAATALAVECAILHNFVWHERFTWRDRAGGPAGAVFRRLLRFNLTTGAVSLIGNVALMRVFTGTLHIRPVAANVAAVICLSLVNFAVSHLFVFRVRVSE
jgi:putative flippase GtrA